MRHWLPVKLFACLTYQEHMCRPQQEKGFEEVPVTIHKRVRHGNIFSLVFDLLFFVS